LLKSKPKDKKKKVGKGNKNSMDNRADSDDEYQLDTS